MNQKEILNWIKKGEGIIYTWSGRNSTQKQWERIKGSIYQQLELHVRVKKYKQHRDNGLSYQMIAEAEGLTKSSVSNFCKRHNIK